MVKLHRYAGMLAGDRRHRIAVAVLLVNVGMIVLAALWRHAAADDGAPPKIDPTEQSAATPPADATLPPADATLPPVDAALAPADEAVPSADGTKRPATLPAAGAKLSSDPVMEELRQIISDPDSGLEIPRLDETSPLARSATPTRSGDWDMRLQQRLETVHALSAAALTLVREARSLSDAGHTSESAALLQRATELREIIAALAAMSDRQP